MRRCVTADQASPTPLFKQKAYINCRRPPDKQLSTAHMSRELSGVRGLLVQKTGLSAREVGEVGGLQGPVLAVADWVGEDEVVAAREGDVLVSQRR
jgi:hypothetical protein